MSKYLVSVAGEVSGYVEAMAKIPGITQKQAARAGLAMQKEFAKAAAAAAKDAERAAKDSGDGLLSHFTFGPSDVIGALSALNDLANSTAALQDQFGDLAITSGLSVDTIAGISLSAAAAGGSLEEVGSVLTKLPKQISAAATGIGATSDAFRQFGIAATNTDGSLRSADAVLRDVSNALASIEDPTQKAAAAVALLGKSGGEFLKAGLGEGTDSIDAFTASARASGLASEEAADAANAWIAASANLKSALTSTGNQLLTSYGPAAADVINKVSLAFVYLREVAMAKVVNGFALATRAATDLYQVLAGDISPETARKRMEGLQATIAKTNAEALEAVRAFHAEQKATAAMGSAAADAEPPVRSYTAANKAASKAADEAAKAAEAEAEALRDLQDQLAAVAEANAKAADPIGAAFAKANQELDTLLVNLAEANLLTDESTAILAQGYARAQEVRATALAEEVQANLDARAQIAAQEKSAHEATLAQIAEQKAARIDAAQNALALAADLASALATIAEQQAEKSGATEEELARIRKRAALFAGTVSIAQAVLTALASAPPPANFALAAATGAVGAVQLGAIASASYNDTPEAQYLNQRGGGLVHFAAGDYFIAAKDPQEVLRQATELAGGNGPDVVKGVRKDSLLLPLGGLNAVLNTPSYDDTPRAQRMSSTPRIEPQQITVNFRLGSKTLQSQLVNSANAPGPHRRILNGGRPWRRGAR